jgi:GNAT superfamily N-acetyltransferase
MVKIESVDSNNKKQLTQFIDFPHDLYDGDPNYVPMVFMEQEALLNPKKSPFLKHSKAAYFLAYKDGKIAGRIAAIRNNNHIAHTGKDEGFFGFFDVINDYEVCKALLDKAMEWLKTEGLTKVIGPTNFSTNETCGLLVENFDEPPFIMMTYNAPYYIDLLEKYGFIKHMDLLCYEFVDTNLPQDVIDFAEKLEARLAERGITIRTINMKNYQQEINNFLPIYNESWAENTGFVPMTNEEVYQIGKDLKPILDSDFILFAFKDGKPIGVALAAPNVNEIQINLKRGRLFPFGFLKFLFGLKKIKTIRIIALGTLKEYRRLGIDACFYVRIMKTGLKKGIHRGEASWMLENNTMINRAIENIRGRVYRKYRLYEKAIGD